MSAGSLVLRRCRSVDARGERGGLVDVVIREGRIAAIAPARAKPLAADGADERLPELDARGGTVVPGLVNMHQHLSLAHPASTEERMIAGEDGEARLRRMTANARKAVGAGVTAVRLVGEPDGQDHAVRSAIARGHGAGPRIWTAGSRLTYRGREGGAVGGVAADSPESFRRLAQQQIDRGADFLKVVLSGGGADGGAVQMTAEEFGAIRGVARDAGLRMAVHTAATPHPILDLLIEDGVDTLEHCYAQPEAILRACVDRPMLLVMTPLVTQSPEYFEAIRLPPRLAAGMRAAAEEHRAAVRRAAKRGARLALGTDFHPHLELGGTWAVVRELELYEEAGVDPPGLLALASRNGAVWLGRQEDMGLVEEGFLADLLVLEQNPLEVGAAAYRGLRATIAGGRRHEPVDPEPPGRGRHAVGGPARAGTAGAAGAVLSCFSVAQQPSGRTVPAPRRALGRRRGLGAGYVTESSSR